MTRRGEPRPSFKVRNGHQLAEKPRPSDEVQRPTEITDLEPHLQRMLDALRRGGLPRRFNCAGEER